MMIRLALKGDRWLALALLSPAILLLALIVVYPMAQLFYDSLFALRLTDHASALFVGLQNYRDAWADPDVRLALVITLLLTLVTVPGALLLGLLLALAGNLEWRWQWPVRLALLLPWALPMSFTGMIFAWFFNSEYGVVNDLLSRLGIAPMAFLLSPTWALVAVSVALIWKTSSFVALILLPGLQAIPHNLYQAALLEGANAWQRFKHITLPLLWPSLVVALIFRSMSAIQTFDIPYAMTQGGPGQSTQTLAMLVNLPYLRHLLRSLR